MAATGNLLNVISEGGFFNKDENNNENITKVKNYIQMLARINYLKQKLRKQIILYLTIL